MNPQCGHFITLDGPGGVGKSTTLTALTEHLREHGHRVHTTTEPSTSPLGRFTRTHTNRIHGHALACLVAADRYRHISTEMQPHLDAGDAVVCDRYLGSTLVVQRLDGVPEPFLLALNADIVLPDLAVLLTADPPTITRRLAARGAHHRFEHDPDPPTREVELYARAEQTLTSLGIRVLTAATSNTTPSKMAARIATAFPADPGSVTPRTRPDGHAATP
ncbi:dTMP kinase [Streptomyces cacaoi]|uniref:dTMP kinase n=1 Tax=Streptomyces cacaoi TaxID=1898 RepID=UPI0011F24EE1|nr:dTMP kinase [Streptomyces cacaoi]